MTIGPMVLPRARSEIEETLAETELFTETPVMAEPKAVPAQSREKRTVLTWDLTPLFCNLCYENHGARDAIHEQSIKIALVLQL